MITSKFECVLPVIIPIAIGTFELVMVEGGLGEMWLKECLSACHCPASCLR
jgi:hypothetical protein